MLYSDEPKNTQINVRCNAAEREMIEQVRNCIRPRVSASKLLLFLCEEYARQNGIIHDTGNGRWEIEEPIS